MFTYSLCDDFAMYKNILKMQYEEKIQEYASKLWLEISDRLEDIEKLYKQVEVNLLHLHFAPKEIKTRYSYQQQLSDALAILRMNYSKYVQVDEQCKVDLSAAKIDKLRRIIDEQADKIEYLTALLEEEKDMREEK
ncbi:C10orf67: Chromosome 10 orf 67, partial [Crotalus adamanteus]